MKYLQEIVICMLYCFGILNIFFYVTSQFTELSHPDYIFMIKSVIYYLLARDGERML